MSTTRHVGAAGEKLAERFLRKQGYKLLARNYRCPRGEMDLIVVDKETVVFVEVKARQDTDLGDPEDNVRLSKQRRLTAIARHWLQQHDVGDRACRFDVIAVLVGRGKPTVRHIPDAFQPLA